MISNININPIIITIIVPFIAFIAVTCRLHYSINEIKPHRYEYDGIVFCISKNELMPQSCSNFECRKDNESYKCINYNHTYIYMYYRLDHTYIIKDSSNLNSTYKIANNDSIVTVNIPIGVYLKDNYNIDIINTNWVNLVEWCYRSNIYKKLGVSRNDIKKIEHQIYSDNENIRSIKSYWNNEKVAKYKTQYNDVNISSYKNKEIVDFIK